MQFNDATNSLGIVQDVLFRTNTNINEFPLKDITRYANDAYSRVCFAIITADGRMQWDDANHTDSPYSVANLVANQKDYGVFVAAPTALQDWLMIDYLEIKDSSGNWTEIQPINRSDIKGQAIDKFMDVASTPTCYDFNGTQVLLFPATNYNSTGGLKMYFNRAPSYFASTDTTKRPGFATIFHQYIPMYVAHQWNIISKNDFSMQPMLDKMEMEIGKFYSRRDKVEVPRLSRAFDSFK